VIARLEGFGLAAKRVLYYTVEQAGFIWERHAKKITTEKNAVVTGRYRASLGHFTSEDLIEPMAGQESDAQCDFETYANGARLLIGTNVEYAPSVEAHHGIMAASIDRSYQEITDAVRDNLLKVLL